MKNTSIVSAIMFLIGSEVALSQSFGDPYFDTYNKSTQDAINKHYEGQPDASWCVRINATPHMGTTSMVYSDISVSCPRDVNMFYCFPRFSTDASAICGNTPPLSSP